MTTPLLRVLQAPRLHPLRVTIFSHTREVSGQLVNSLLDDVKQDSRFDSGDRVSKSDNVVSDETFLAGIVEAANYV